MKNIICFIAAVIIALLFDISPPGAWINRKMIELHERLFHSKAKEEQAE